MSTPASALTIGARAQLVHTVEDKDTARHWGNDVPVLATPILLWLSEITAMRITDDVLAADGRMTVGAHHDTAHLAPTLVGETVTIEAELTERTERILVFAVEAHDSRGPVLRGHHRRGIVERNRFLAKLDAIERSS